MKTAIYARVSTEDQAHEGTSLISQKEACLAKAQELGYETGEELIFIETFSGLTLERPELTKLRASASSNEIDAIIIHTPDRLCRVGEDILFLAKEFKLKGIKLIFVKEQWEDTLNGKLIAFLLGWASELEVAQIKERTMRGIRERVKLGKFPSGRRARLYGYTYDPSVGKRHINKDEAQRVREIFRWFVEEGLTLNGVIYRLRTLGIPTPDKASFWSRSTVYKILTNASYIGQTYCFKCVHTKLGNKTSVITKPTEEWTELVGATPPIISKGLFNQAQARLAKNRENASRNGKVKYLLRGYIYCAHCNRKFWGYSRGGEPDKSNQRYYYCMGRRQIITPDKCDNRGYQADYLEGVVWEQIEAVLSDPQFLTAQLERIKNEPDQANFLEQELKDTERRLRDLDKEQERLLQWALKGFPETTVIGENEKINKSREQLKEQRTELEGKIKSARESRIELNEIEKFCELAKSNLPNFTYEDKRLSLDALQIKVWIDGDTVLVKGVIPIGEGDTVSTLPCLNRHNITSPIHFALSVR